jgi:indolepyruvate ferredoxin oxidoreductase
VEVVEAAVQRDPSSRAQAAGNRLLSRADLPEATLALVDWRLKDLIDYQGTSLAVAYLETVQRVADAERRIGPRRTDLSEAVARYMYKLLAYKDEYEVARLHLDDNFQRQLQKEFPEARVRYKLHPPMLRAMGMKRKLALPPAIAVPLFRLLCSLRRLRGTPFDPFGYAAARKVERRLIEDYRSAIESVARKLSAEGYDRAVQLAELPDLVRGYEEIKLRGVEQFDRRLKALTEEDSA